LLFQAQPPQVDAGTFTEISWSVTDADRLVLMSDIFSQTLDSLEGSQKIRLERQAVFTLKAYSNSLPGRVIEQVLDVPVSPPPGEPAPVIVDFRVEPATITAGQSVTITWQVSGAEEVSIQPIGDHLPSFGMVRQTPAGTLLYVLAASNGDQSTNALRQITVNPIPPTPTPEPTPTPTPAPLAPTIELFSVSPAQPVQISTEEVEVRLDWVVSGAVTNITLTGGPLGNEGFSQLASQDSISLMLSTDAVFVLRAMNGDQVVLRTLEVRLRQAAPLAAYNLLGQVITNPSPPPDTGTLLTWAHDADTTIIGFRLYRNSGAGFILIAAEDQLTNLVRQYLDLSAGNCMIYYITAVYQNSNGQRLETSASNQWASPCP
jgi:hypothetical protein